MLDRHGLRQRHARDGRAAPAGAMGQRGGHRPRLAQALQAEDLQQRQIGQQIGAGDHGGADQQHLGHVAPGLAQFAAEVGGFVPAAIGQQHEHQPHAQQAQRAAGQRLDRRRRGGGRGQAGGHHCRQRCQRQ
ncbi:hypothetical protein, partial [Bordetella bronchiseptica]|uniref:hypothetical protein n=1 Tax=Bordetella bronchiseptica TaxID=518 RepID=UPI0019110AA5